MSARRTVFSARGQNGAQYDVVTWVTEGPVPRDLYEVQRTGGTGPTGKPMPPQKCGTYYSKTAAVNRANDLIRLSAGVYRELGKQAARKAKRAEKAPEPIDPDDLPF